MLPLHHTRILDLTRLLPGAVCTMLLRDLGAEIIKVEDPRVGDYARHMPPLRDGMGIFFHSSNAGKRSIAIDLKAEAGQAVLHKLVETADVLIEGFRPGVAARLGADYETLQAISPRLVYCSLSGWGQSGPDALLSGHDLNYIARNGLLGAASTPTTPGAQVADVSGSYVAVMAALAALLQRERTGRGQLLDVSLSEAAMPMALAAWVEANAPPDDSAFLSLRGESACYRVYACADGRFAALGAIEPKFWINFCRAVERPEWIERQTARDQQPRLIEALAEMFASKPAAAWATLLESADCCFSLVAAPSQLPADTQLAARGMVGVSDGGLPWMRSPIRLGNPPEPGTAPRHGQHSREILAEIGYKPAEIDALIDARLIRQAP